MGFQCEAPVQAGRAFFVVGMKEENTRRDKRLDKIDRLVDDILQGRDLYRVETRIRGNQRQPTVDVFIDGDHGVNIDQCAAVSRSLNASIELEGIFVKGFKLDVSSPGLDRPLQLPRQFRRHLGRDLKVLVHRPDSGDQKPLAGKLVEAAENGITLETSGERLELSFDQIERAVVTPSF